MGTSGRVPAIVVVMGVSAAGKSTVARRLSGRLKVPFAEGDDFHPLASIKKMASGRPLDDDDREPWLRNLAAWITETAGARTGAVLSCSALKRRYRDIFRAAGPGVWFLYLELEREAARSRLSDRTGHFMPPWLLESQYEALQPLQPDEPGLTVDATADMQAKLALALAALARLTAGKRP